MNLIVEASLDDEEQVIVGDFIHAHEMWAAQSAAMPRGVRHTFTKAWGGQPLPLKAWESLCVYMYDLSSDELLLKCPDDDARMHATENFMNARGLMYEIARAIRLSQPGAIAATPGP